MPKKPEASNTESIVCPACECSISPDGKKLLTKSKKLADFEEVTAGMTTVQSAMETAEGRITELETENKKLKEEAKLRVIPKRVENPDEELES